MKKLAVSLIVASLLLTALFGIGGAWPNQPPDRATISGQGLKGEVPITDSETLRALKLGSLEDFDAGAIAAPMVGEGYKITRWFYQGTFNFGQLRYYPGAEGQRGYVYFEDGPDIEGGPTPYDREWFYATPAGDASMQRLLRSLGVTTFGGKSASKSASQESIPITGATSGQVSADSEPSDASARTPILALVAALGLIAAGVALFTRRLRAH